MSKASNALNAETERTRPYRYQLLVSASSYESPELYEALQPRCACSCGRKLRGEVTVMDGRQYVADHATTVTGDRA